MATDRITRRGFVGAVGVTAGSAALLGAAGASAAVGANDKVRLGLIGAGSRGNQLLDTFLDRTTEVDVVAVADVDDQHAAETAEQDQEEARQRRRRPSRDYRAMLDDKDIDAVVIATPDHWHALPAIQAVLAGKDVYVEKPVGHNVAEGQAMIRAARKYEQDHGRRHPAAVVVALPEGRRGRPLGQARQGLLGPDLELREHQPGRHGPVPRHRRRRRTSTTTAGSAPRPTRPFNPNRFHLLFRWFFDYAGGMMSDWGVHLNDIVLWALDAKAPKTVSATGGIFTTDDDRDTPDTLQVVYEFPGCTLTYSMRKGNGLKFNGHDYGILFCGTDGSLLLDRAGYEIIPDKVVLPYGIKLVHGDRPLRKIDLEGREGQGGRRPARARPELPRLPVEPRAADLRHRDRPPLDQHLPPRQHRLQARPQARLGRRRPRRSRTTPRPTPCSPASRARATSCPRSERVGWRSDGAPMKPAAGPILRRVGLLIEMACLAGGRHPA